MHRTKHEPPPAGEQARDRHDWEKLPPSLQARDLARHAEVAKLLLVVRNQHGKVDETVFPGPDDPLQVPITIEGGQHLVSLAWVKLRRWSYWLLECSGCSKRARTLVLAGGVLRCKRCAGIEVRRTRLPPILRPITKRLEFERLQKVERRNVRIAARQRFRDGVTVLVGSNG